MEAQTCELARNFPQSSIPNSQFTRLDLILRMMQDALTPMMQQYQRL
jgi:hypothetical protein